MFPTVFSLLREAYPKAEIGSIYQWEGIQSFIDTKAMFRCKKVTISGLHLKNSACWGLSFDRCEDLSIVGVTIFNRAFWNNDGIDVSDSHRVFIQNCKVNSADDGICLKSHDNDYVSYYNGIALGYGRFSGGLNTYHTLCRGARVFELTENKDTFETWVRLETNRFICRVTVPYSFTTNDPQYKPKP